MPLANDEFPPMADYYPDEDFPLLKFVDTEINQSYRQATDSGFTIKYFGDQI